MTDTMTALFGGTGPHWEAREVPVPEPGPGQVLVRARAVALNNVEVVMLDQAASTIDIDALSYRNLRVRGVSFGFTRPDELGRVIAGLAPEVIPAVADGRIRPILDSVLSFGQAKEAVDRLRGNRAHGKIVLTVPW